MHFSAEYREKRQLEIKNKILERSGYDEVFYGDDGGEKFLTIIKLRMRFTLN